MLATRFEASSPSLINTLITRSSSTSETKFFTLSEKSADEPRRKKRETAVTRVKIESPQCLDTSLKVSRTIYLKLVIDEIPPLTLISFDPALVKLYHSLPVCIDKILIMCCDYNCSSCCIY